MIALKKLIKNDFGITNLHTNKSKKIKNNFSISKMILKIL